MIENIELSWPVYTDHLLISFEIKHEKNLAGISWRRDWRLYDREFLCRKLSVYHVKNEGYLLEVFYDEVF